MTLREEVEKYFKDLDKIFHEANVAQIGHCVLKFIDQHEAEKPLLCARCAREMRADNQARNEPDEAELKSRFVPWREIEGMTAKPSEERPARKFLFGADWDATGEASPIVFQFGFRAIVESIDANTAAIREAKR